MYYKYMCIILKIQSSLKMFFIYNNKGDYL